jgi:hypothetical protein
MQKLLTKKERDKKTRRNQILIGGVLILIMVLSALGTFSMRGTDGSSKVTYNGVEFVETDGFWSFTVGEYAFETQYNPEEVSEIGFSSDALLQNYDDKPLYFAGDEGEGKNEIIRNIYRFVSRISNACLVYEGCEEDLPEKNCSVDNVIVIQEPMDNESETIYQEENCVFIVSEYSNQTKYADVFLFKVLGL